MKKKFLKFVRNNWQKVLILFILLFIMYYESPIHNKVNTTTGTQLESMLGQNMTEGTQQLSLDGYFESLPGDAYSLGLKFSPFFSENDNKNNEDEIKLNIYVQGLTTSRQQIGSITINSQKGSQLFEKSFLAQGRYNQIIVEKDNLSFNEDINILVKYIDRLNVQSKEEIDNLRPTLYGSDNAESKQTEARLNRGASIVDLGHGLSIYHYRQSDTSLAFSNVLEQVDFDSDKATNLFLNKVNNSIIANAINNSSYYFKFDTIYPITQVAVSIDQPHGNYLPAEIYYTFDKTKWIKIDMSNDQIQAPENANMLYLKITYARQRKTDKNSLFGINELNFSALLVTK